MVFVAYRNTAFSLVSHLAMQFGSRGDHWGVYPGGCIHTHKHKTD